jgi:hypothetical protein
MDEVERLARRPATMLGRVAQRLLQAGFTEEAVASHLKTSLPELRRHLTPASAGALPGIDLTGVPMRHPSREADPAQTAFEIDTARR